MTILITLLAVLVIDAVGTWVVLAKARRNPAFRNRIDYMFGKLIKR
jgi:hypothetical protein